MVSIRVKICGLFFCVAATASAAETVESIKGKLDALNGRVTSVTCKEQTILHLEHGSGNSTHSDVSGTYEFQRKDGKTCWRLEAKGREVNKTALAMPKNPTTGQTPSSKVMESKNDIDSLMLDDGTATWKITLDKAAKLLGTKPHDTATKMDVRFINYTLADKAFVELLQSGCDLKVLPDETIEGQACFVLEATPRVMKGGAAPGKGVTVFSIQQTTGLIVKFVVNDAKSKPMNITTRTEVKINTPIPADRFTLPPGIAMIDGTKK